MVAAIRTAGGTQQAWRRVPLAERAAILLRYHDLVLDHRHELVDLVIRESGKARKQAFEEVAHVAFGAEHRFREGGYGNAILSRFPLTDSDRVDLTIGKRKQRGLVKTRAHAKLEHGTRSVLVFNLHLGLSGSERATQLERFLECHPFAHVHHDTPVVVGPSPRAAAEGALRMGPTARLAREAGAQHADTILRAVESALTPFAGADGQVRLTGSTWIVSATNGA